MVSKVGQETLSAKSRWEVLAPLQNRDFALLWASNGLWWQAMWIEQLVLGWLVLEMTNSAWLVALIGFFRFIPLLFIGGISAAITDRFERRSIVLLIEIANVVTLVFVTLLFLLGKLAYWHIATASLAIGCGWTLGWTSRRALIPDLVGRERVVDAMVVEGALQSLTRISGPLMAGYFMAVLGVEGALIALTAMSFLGVIVLAQMKTQSRAPNRPKGIVDTWRKQVEGLNYVWRHPRILGVVIVTIVMNMWAFPYQNLLPVFARDVLMQGPVGLGWLAAASGIGSVLGLLVVNWGRRHHSNERVFCVGSLFSCLAVIGFALSTSYYLSLIMLALAGLAQAGFSIMQSSVILVESPDEMRGRAMGALVLAIGTGPLGRLLVGAMAENWGAPLAVGSMAVFAVVAIGAVIALLAGFYRPSGRPSSAAKESDRAITGTAAEDIDARL